MLFGTKENVDDLIVRILLNGPLQIKTVHHLLLPTSNISLRAVYKAINHLLHSGVLVRGGNKVWVHEEWLRRVRENLSTPIPALGQGERAQYKFSTISHLDAFWKTIALQLESLEQETGAFFYNPHNFWAYVPARKDSEDAYYKHFLTEKRHAYFVVGGQTKADMQFKRTYQHAYLQINTEIVPGFNRRDHLTILGDHIVTVRLPASLAVHIDNLFEDNDLPEEIGQRIVEEYEIRRDVHLTVERNGRKALKLRTSLARDFHIPKRQAGEKFSI